MAFADNFLLTILPVLVFARSAFFKPPTVLSMAPRKTRDFVSLVLAFETFFSFIPADVTAFIGVVSVLIADGVVSVLIAPGAFTGFLTLDITWVAFMALVAFMTLVSFITLVVTIA